MEDYEKLNMAQKAAEKDPFTEPRYRQFYNLLKNKSGRVLDIGCSTGKGGRVLKELNPKFMISGLDIVKARLDQLPKDVYENNIHGSATEIPTSDGTFDAVVAGEFVEHLYAGDLEKTINEVFRVLKIGGQVLLTTPNPGDIKRKWRKESVLGQSHLSQHHPDILKMRLRMAGFSGVKIFGSGKVSSYLGYRFPALFVYGSYLVTGLKF
jgi:SAM-dependent methyltransferase